VQKRINQESIASIDPLTDPRWPAFLEHHPDASVFHTRQWMDAIRRTYGFEPVVFTTANSGDLTDGVAFCRISSWLTGKRLVSMPFSDHCQPLTQDDELKKILEPLQSQRKSNQEKYIELRPVKECGLGTDASGFAEKASFSFQRIDLRPELKAVYSGFHDSCIRRKIKRAERESLTYEAGRSEELLAKFRHLLMLTRRRHKLPPQPAAWFRNIVDCLGEMVTIHVASQGDTPVASILTLKHKRTLVYKYGCSDGQFSNLGGTPMLFWKAIQQAKAEGIEQFDLGRSDLDEPGLIAFKEHLGAVSTKLTYYRNPQPAAKKEVQPTSVTDSVEPSGGLAKMPSRWAREALVRLPDSLLAGVGEVLYRHIG
jgi:CelD/BcsL family acetyltransferase involved in cellulose biosynthesis